MTLTKEDLLLAAEAAEKWPLRNFNEWTIEYYGKGLGNIKTEDLKPGFA